MRKFALIILFSIVAASPVLSQPPSQEATTTPVLLLDSMSTDVTLEDVVEVHDEFYAHHTKSGLDYKIARRWEWVMRNHVGPNDTFVNVPYTTRYNCSSYGKSERHLRHRGEKIFMGTWRPLGPSRFTLNSLGLIGGLGRINALGFDPNDERVLYAGPASGPLFESDDFGISWRAISEPFGISGIALVPEDPDEPKTIYVLTGDGNGYGGSSYYLSSIGVMKTTDGGRSWNATAPLVKPANSVYYGYALKIHPVRNEVLFATTNLGLYMTTNGGEEWSKAEDEDDSDFYGGCEGQKTGYFYDVEFNPSDPSIVYASTQCAVLKMKLAEDRTLEPVKKTIFIPSPNTPPPGETSFYSSSRIEMAVTARAPEIVYAIFAGYYGLAGFYRSTDSAETFSLRANTPNLIANDIAGSGQGIAAWTQQTWASWYYLVVAASPTNPDTVIAGGVNLWKSEDGGSTWGVETYWNQRSPPFLYRNNHADHHALVFSDFALFNGNDGGVYMKPYIEKNWANLSDGLNITQIYRLCGHRSDRNILYYGAQDNGVNKLLGQTANQIRAGDGTGCAVDPSHPQIIYFGVSPGGTFFKSMDAGSSLVSISPPAAGAKAPWVTPFAIDPDNTENLYICYDDIWTSPDRGAKWEQISDFGEDAGCVQMVVTPEQDSHPSYVYRASERTVWSTTKGDWNFWQEITGNLCSGSAGSTCEISNLAVTPGDPTEVWVTFGDFEAGQKVFKGSPSANGIPFDWDNVSGSLPNVPANTVLIDDNDVYVGTDCGVFYRPAGALDWISFNMNLGNYLPEGLSIPTVMVQDLIIQKDRMSGLKWLRAGTFNLGMWESPLDLSKKTPAPLPLEDDEGEE